MIRSTKRFSAVLVLLAMLVLAGCGGGAGGSSDGTGSTGGSPSGDTGSNGTPDAGTPKQGGKIVIGHDADVLTLDPALTTDEASRPVQALLFNSLVKFNEKMEPVADLAESWDVRDGTTYVFKLRQGVKFHNGDPLLASDVKFSIDRMSDPDVASRWASHFADVKEVRVVGDDTIEIELTQPNAAFLSAIASYMFVLQESFVKDNPNLQRVANGTGPYVLDEWVPNTSVTLKRFADYFDADQTYLDEIVFQIIPDEASRLAALRTGEVHFLHLKEPQNGPQYEQMQQSGQIGLAKVVANKYHLLGFNVKRPPFDNPKVREAIQYAIDRDVLLATAGFGQGEVTGILSPALGDWALPVDSYPQYTRDVEKAKQLLKEAGFENGFEFNIMAPTNHPIDLNSAIAIAEQLKEIGLTANVDRTEWGTYVQNWVDRDYDTFVGHNGNWTDPDLAMYAALVTDGSTNASQYSNPEIDDLLNRGRTSTDYAERKQIYDELQRRLVKDGPMVYTFAEYMFFAHSPKLNGYVANVTSPFRGLANAWLQD